MIGYFDGHRRISHRTRPARPAGEDVQRDLLSVPTDAADPTPVNASQRDTATGAWADPAGRWPLPMLLLVAAVAAGVVAQGGYYPQGRFLVAALAGAALIAALRMAPPRSGWDRWAVPAACAALGGWALARAAAAGSVGAGVPTALTVACVAVGLVVLLRADAAQRELCALSLVGIGVLVAVSGWVGVVWRVPPLALVFEQQTRQQLWRASATLTYPNAAAALLAVLAVLAAALLLARPRSPLRQTAVVLLFVGLAATLSRGGALALLVGLAVLGVLAGVPATVRHLAPPALGAVVAVAALAPSFPATARAQPLLAVAGLAAGLVVALGLPRLPGRMRAVAVLAGFAGVAAAAGLLLVRSPGMAMLADTRASLDSPTRTESAQAAWRLVAEHPLAGVGPGRALFTWTIPDGRTVTGRYAHNEYLQVLVELGAIGSILLLLVLAAIAVTLRRGRATAQPATLWCGAVAGLGVLTVHSGLDFLWQLPVIPLTGALLAGLAGPVTTRTVTGPAPVEVQ